MDKLLLKIKESRFSSSLGWLHCGSNAIKRGKKDEKRGISNQKIVVFVTQDWNNNIIARMAGKSRIKAKEINAIIGDDIAHSSLLYTNTAINHKRFAVAKNLKHKAIDPNQNSLIFSYI